MSPLPHTLIHKSMRLIARGLAAGRLKTVASGVDRIPTEGPALLVARHYHHLYDGLALFAAVPRPFHIVVTLDWVTNRPMGFLMQTLTRIARWPVLLRSDALERGTTSGTELFSQKDVLRYQRKALREAADLLVEGRIVVVFPEGYPNVDSHYTPKTKVDEFLPFKPGFVNIALRAEKRLQRQIPIIPAGLRYTRGEPWVAYLNIGEPVHRKNFKHARELITHLEESVRRLSTAETSEASRNQ